MLKKIAKSTNLHRVGGRIDPELQHDAQPLGQTTTAEQSFEVQLLLVLKML